MKDSNGIGDDRSTATDGGTTRSPFEAISDVEETRRDRYRKRYETYVYAPLSIIWDDWRARIGIAIIAFYVLVGTLGVYLIEPTSNLDGSAFIQPFETWEHPLGTDRMGRDLLADAVHSTRPMLIMMISGGLFTVSLGTAIGAVAGYKGGITDTVLNSITDVFINIPGLPLVIVLSVMFEPRHPVMVGILLSVAAWAGLARAIRSQVLTIRMESFTESARAMDIPTSRIIRKDVLPHLMPYLVINLMNAIRNIIFSAVGLYFLGVLPFEDQNWGITLYAAYDQGAHYRPGAIHWLLIPMVAIIGISIGLILLGQSLDRVFNPRVRARHENGGGEVDPEEDVDTDNTGMIKQV
ncbi:ABC transporter permease [Natrarchaeobius sp. A-rgal3]|uniref:ABC transporter permease n=1 Tax=Natrarchaeobius versutus TaxID=1679078 RepID=UPI003510019D